jgi:hypothetical protein
VIGAAISPTRHLTETGDDVLLQSNRFQKIKTKRTVTKTLRSARPFCTIYHLYKIIDTGTPSTFTQYTRFLNCCGELGIAIVHLIWTVTLPSASNSIKIYKYSKLERNNK